MNKLLYKLCLPSAIISGALIAYYYFFADNKLIFNLSHLICKLCAIFLIYLTAKFIIIKIKKAEPLAIGSEIKSILDNNLEKWLYRIILCCIIIAMFTGSCFQSIIGFHKLELEPSEGAYTYNVVIENEQSESFTVSAIIYTGIIEEYEAYSYNPTTITDEEKVGYDRVYTINRIILNNGTHLYFEEPIIFENIYDKSSGTDQNDESWEVTLTNQHISNSSLIEYSPLSIFDYFIWVLPIVCAAIQLIIWLKA